MGTPGTVTSADIPALLKTADDFQATAEDVHAIAKRVAEVPPAAEAAYGSRAAAEAMAALLSGWGAELELTEKAVQDMSTGVRTVVENLREADRLAARRTGMHGL